MQSSSYATFPLIRLAIRSTPSPFREKAFIVMRYARNLAVLPDYRNQPSLIPAPNHPPWHADFNRRRACAARPKGESRKRTEESLLSSGRFRLSPATENAIWQSPHPSRYSLDTFSRLGEGFYFIVVCYARDLAVLPNYRPPPRLIPAPNPAPVAR